ncbi:uroporphyrinogen-III synthase [Candidatus Tisiphia endosymbiont of Nemotelus uliginosus]|uniref:uroporphyrinogen-III synthase n=1 Tax=Candidatus Tisiphia endosymbiont of Nemotelus uliginosus TaxID=3077926 RepID=UPI0035C93106
MKSVLLTRSTEDNYDIIQTLENNNFAYPNASIVRKNGISEKQFKYICSPLVKYHALDFDPTILHNYNNVIITSKVATKLFVSWFNNYPNLQLQPNITKNIWVVGDSSNIILRQHNFTVHYIAKNIQELIYNIPPQLYNHSIYLSSNEITQELPSPIKRQIIYEVQYANTLQHLEEIKKGVDYILLYSQNSAKTLITLLRANNLLKLFFSTQVLTISEKVASIIRFFTKNVVSCKEGKPEEMLKLLISTAAASKIRNLL